MLMWVAWRVKAGTHARNLLVIKDLMNYVEILLFIQISM